MDCKTFETIEEFGLEVECYDDECQWIDFANVSVSLGICYMSNGRSGFTVFNYRSSVRGEMLHFPSWKVSSVNKFDGLVCSLKRGQNRTIFNRLELNYVLKCLKRMIDK